MVQIDQFYQGCLLASVVHAVGNCLSPELSHEQSWDGHNYNLQNSQGTRGTVTFSEQGCVAGFFDPGSPRSPFRAGGNLLADTYINGMSDELEQVFKEETLQYLLENTSSGVAPAVTATFWQMGDRLTSADTWEDMLIHGGHVVRIQCLPPKKALREWDDEYELGSRLKRIVWELYQARSVSDTVTVSTEQLAMLRKVSVDEGLAECLRSLAEIGIVAAIG